MYYKQPETEQELMEDIAQDIDQALAEVYRDVTERNTYMNERDRVVYQDGLFEGLEFPDGSDKTLFNFLQRVVQIHKSQLMGRGFQMYSTYNKEDLSIYPEGSEELKQAELKNKQLKVYADTRKQAMDAIIVDNGGMGKFEQAAEIGSTYGGSVFKVWADKKLGTVRISLLETPQNYFPLWSDSDFRDRDGDAYVWQISETQASKQYGKKLKDGKYFAVAQEGNPFGNSGGDNQTNDPLSQAVNASGGDRTQSSRNMVNVIEFTGIRKCWSNDGKKLIKCKPGEEKPFNALIVGGEVVETTFNPKWLPRYYLIPNTIIPRRNWGGSDITNAAIEINRTIIEVMSTWVTLYHKETAPIYKAKGFTSQGSIPRRKKKTATFVPMGMEQDLEQLQSSQVVGQVSKQLVEELKDALVRVTGIGRVLFDDPTVNANSNQALMTTLKGVIDIVETKQKIWEPIIIEMFTDALELATYITPDLKEAVKDPGWKVYVRWPSVLRREDATYQQMWLNRFNAGTTSVDSYLEAMGVENTTEEVDRIRDDMSDPVRAAIMGKQLGALAAQTITPPQTGAPAPQVKYNVNVNAKTENDPAMNEAVIGEVMGADPEAFPGQPEQPQPTPDQANPQLTPDQNTGQTASQPGSGAPAVSAEGAIAMAEQQSGA